MLSTSNHKTMNLSKKQKQLATLINELKQEIQRIETDPTSPNPKREQMYQRALKDIESLSPELQTQLEYLINNHPWIKKD